MRLSSGLISALLAISLGAGPASASGFMISKIGGDLAGPTEPNAASIFWNPAALGPIDGASLMLDLNMAWRTMDYERSWLQDFERNDRPSNPGQMATLDLLPMAAFTIKPRLAWLTIGVGVYVPYGNRAEWPKYDLEAQLERPEGEREPVPPQAYQSISGGVQAIYTTPAVSIAPLHWWGIDWLWLGLSASWVNARVDATRIKDYSAEINELLGFEYAAPEQVDYSGTAKLDFSGNAWAFAVGLYARPWDFLRFGVSWTSGSKLVLPGTVQLNLPSFVAGAMGAGSLVRSKAFLHMDLPPVVRAGIHWDITDWLVFRIHMEYVHWQLYKDIRIHELELADEDGIVEGLADITEFIDARDYKNAVDLRTGFRVFATPWWMFFLGVGYDTTAVPDKTTTPDLYDAKKIGLAFGTWIQIVPLLEWMTGTELDRDDRIALAIGTTWIRFLDRTVTHSTTDPPITGHYQSEVVLLNTNLEARF